MIAVLLLALGLASSGTALAQPYAPGEVVRIPGAAIAGWGSTETVDGRFGKPASKTGRLPVVLILHDSGGVDGRGAYYAQALNDAGIATLEITMFTAGGRPRVGTKARCGWWPSPTDAAVARAAVVSFFTKYLINSKSELRQFLIRRALIGCERAHCRTWLHHRIALPNDIKLNARRRTVPRFETHIGASG